MDEAQPENTRIYVSTSGIVPEEPRNNGGNDEADNEDHGKVVPVLPPNNRVLAQVADVGDTGLAAGFHQHPANVGVEETFVGVVGIQFGVGVTMMSAVTTRPPFNGTFNSARASNSKEVLQW